MLQRLAEDRARLAELDSQILELELAFATLRSQRSVVKERLDTYKYPVLTLPNEVIADIFVHFIPEYPACPPLGGSQSPLLLTRICRLWREIAHATPKLWRAVSLPIRNPFPLDPKNIWLSRAGFFPLAIRMNETDGHYDVDEWSLFAAILPYRLRCEYLELRLGYDVVYLASLESDFPLLKHLDLEFDEEPDDKIEFSSVPMLRSAVLDGVAAYWIVLPWSQLTTLALHTVSLNSCAPILEKVTNLSECSLDLRLYFNSENYIADPHIMLPRLKSLTANGDEPMNTFLDSFTLPLLSKLNVCEKLLGPDPISSLTTFISRSECKLQCLRISCMQAGSTTYSAAFPSIQELSFGPVKDPQQPLHLLSV
ncbi:F-box domain-containing protein [Favolaschia claudopus]|uniref:F-box domain-containing protein n=1 Tax=Favolaschia claudopus TaxID=2862362 RepID=A0AAW0AZM4_9AGAR